MHQVDTLPISSAPIVDQTVGRGTARGRLLVDGQGITWRGTTVGYDEVVGLAHSTTMARGVLGTRRQYRIDLYTAAGPWRIGFAVPAQRDVDEVFATATRTLRHHVEPRLVGHLLGAVASEGSVRVAGLEVDQHGVGGTTSRFAWRQFLGTRLAFDTVLVRYRGLDGQERRTAVPLSIRDAVLLPRLLHGVAGRL